MDAAFTLAGLISDLNALLREPDFEGAEELLNLALGRFPSHQAFLHFQFGKLYIQWNKMTSAINHLHLAVDLCRDEILQIQILEELKLARERQLEQQP